MSTSAAILGVKCPHDIYLIACETRGYRLPQYAFDGARARQQQQRKNENSVANYTHTHPQETREQKKMIVRILFHHIHGDDVK